MLTALRQRLDHDDDEGFTLIELMVVVLIIGILLAIAIPTFLGARAKAQNRSAQSNLRNALTAEKTIYVDTQKYDDATTTALSAIEPALTFTAGGAPVSGQVSVVTTNSAADVWLGAKSDSGTCYYIHDNSASATQYGSSTTSPCPAPALAATGNWQPNGFPG